MEDFPFDLNLNYKTEEYVIKPPPNFTQLKEMASKKYEISIEEMLYTNENEEEIVLKNEQDYADLIEYATEHNLKEVHIIINREKEEDEENEEKEEKNEKSGKNVRNGGGDIDIEMNCDYDYYGDTRNRKGKSDEGYSKHNKGFKEKKRIGYIIEKKEMQREETLKSEKNRKKKK